jgi:hypothetical protein
MSLIHDGALVVSSHGVGWMSEFFYSVISEMLHLLIMICQEVRISLVGTNSSAFRSPPLRERKSSFWFWIQQLSTRIMYNWMALRKKAEPRSPASRKGLCTQRVKGSPWVSPPLIQCTAQPRATNWTSFSYEILAGRFLQQNLKPIRRIRLFVHQRRPHIRWQILSGDTPSLWRLSANVQWAMGYKR